ncbi:hypothetical protein GCM10017744_022740 [Streptomyces antimycoticus]
MPSRRVVELDAELSAALAEVARRHGLTLNTVVQGAWATLLGRLAGRDDVVFGATVSGRPPEVPGIETMIGLFINTLPVRVRLDQSEPLSALLERIQRQQSALMPYPYLRLSDVQRLAGLGELFDSATVFENYPAPPRAWTPSRARWTSAATRRARPPTIRWPCARPCAGQHCGCGWTTGPMWSTRRPRRGSWTS